MVKLESFSYNSDEYGCVDVDICEDMDKYIINIEVLYWVNDNERFISITQSNRENISYEELIARINEKIRENNLKR